MDSAAHIVKIGGYRNPAGFHLLHHRLVAWQGPDKNKVTSCPHQYPRQENGHHIKTCSNMDFSTISKTQIGKYGATNQRLKLNRQAWSTCSLSM